jgi:probable F420-dependent oxidoreductase
MFRPAAGALPHDFEGHRMTAPRFSVCLPNSKEGKTHPPGAVDPRWIREMAVSAEATGFDGLWVSELLQAQGGAGEGGRVDVRAAAAAPVSYYDPIATIGYVAALTERVRITTATLVLPHHHPVLLSRQVATLDVLTGGRITLGVGLGGSMNSFRQLRGDLSPANRATIMDEFLQALRLQWENPVASYAGKYVHITDAEAYPKPVQHPLPIYMAGTAEGALRRLARFGQGWIDSHSLPGTIADVVARIHGYRAEQGIQDSGVQVARQFYIGLGQTRAEARQCMSEGLGGNTPQAVVADEEERRIVGTPDDVADRLSRYPVAGVTEICAVFYGGSLASVQRQLSLFADEVIPRITAASGALPV